MSVLPRTVLATVLAGVGCRSPDAPGTTDSEATEQHPPGVGGTIDTDVETGTISASPPRAVLRPQQQVVAPGSAATLDGSPSTDPDGDQLAWHWEVVDGPTATLSAPEAARTDVVAVVPGTIELTLHVTDTTERVDTARALVHVSEGNEPPVAVIAPPPRSGEAGTVVTFDGAGSSDPEDAALEARWTLLSRPDPSQATLAVDGLGATLVTDVDGSYVVELRVTDGELVSWPAVAVFVAGTGSTGEGSGPAD